MRAAGSTAALAIVLGWVVFALAGLALAPAAAVAVGIGAGAVLALLRNSLPLRAAVALLAPFGVMLPALALRDMAAALGVAVVPFTTVELAAFLLGYTLFLAAAFGAIPLNLYRLGYAPAPVAAMVLAVCACGVVSGHWFLALVAVAGQAAWAARLGSSNWFDHVVHLALWPVAAVALAARLI